MNIVRLHAVALPVLLMLISASSGDLVGYVATNTPNSVVYLTNFDTGEQIALGPSGIAEISSLEYADGALYAGSGGGTRGLWEVDVATGLGTFIGTTARPRLLHNLAAAPDGSLFGNGAIWDTDKLLAINTETGEDVMIGSLAPYPAMAAFAIDDTGLAIGWDSGSDWLFRIDLSDASTTSIGQLNGAFRAFDFGPDGTLYAWGWNTLYEIDPVNLTANLVRSFPIGGSSFTIPAGPGPLPILGDMNDDGSVDGLDVDPFVHAVIFEPFNLRGDMNGDGSVTGLDVARFVNALTAGGAQAVPEPSTLALATIVLLVLASPWRRWGGWAVGRHT